MRSWFERQTWLHVTVSVILFAWLVLLLAAGAPSGGTWWRHWGTLFMAVLVFGLTSRLGFYTGREMALRNAEDGEPRAASVLLPYFGALVGAFAWGLGWCVARVVLSDAAWDGLVREPIGRIVPTADYAPPWFSGWLGGFGGHMAGMLTYDRKRDGQAKADDEGGESDAQVV